MVAGAAWGGHSPCARAGRRTTMATTPVPVKQAPALRTVTTDPWQAFRTEMDRLFYRFSGGFFGFPSMRRLFDVEPYWRDEALPGMTMPAVDVFENEKGYK